MNTRHPNQQPESHDTMDDVLDSLLTGADQDLQASLEPVLDVDAGLDAILGHHTTPPHKTQPPRITPKVAGLRSSLKSYVSRVLAVVTPFLTWLTLITGIKSQIEITGTTFEATVTDPGTHSVDEQITAIIKLVHRAHGFKLLRKIRDLDYSHQALRELQEGIAGRRLSRIEADKLIGDVETKLQRTLTSDSLTSLLVPFLVTTSITGGSLLVNREPTAAVAMVLLFLMFAYEFRVERRLPPWRRKTVKLALNKLQQLRPEVKRLFDDTNDWSLNTSPR